HRIRLVPHLESTRSLPFEPIIRDAIENGPVIRVGRFTDRQTNGNNSAPNAPNALKIAFRSKVVSRGHAEIWVEEGGKFFIRDTKSSSGTFLNHIRLANANVESRPFPLKDGDIIQLGIDYQGGQQEIYRCVKIKVEIGREWQSAANAFNTNALRRLNNLGVHSVLPSSTLAPPTIPSDLSDSNGNSTDCCICLFPITVCQALFVAPCSHAFHYKCLRPMLVAHHPGFSCPLCRSFADLESDVE
ncbi:SMAD/FHA domain-containing protein, partial [Cantharellus anzutake]|uniref:SMAD/FHA domain-containing protein n=1 Tax=Cantharellus anzutake TaxID=1750568 RepID=UPI001904B30B